MAWSRYSPTLHRGLAKRRPLDRAFRRHLDEPKAFTFWHLWTGNWLLGFWSKRFGDKGIHEHKVLNHDPGMKDGPQVSRALMAEIRDTWRRPVDTKDELAAMKSEERSRTTADWEADEEIVLRKQSERKRLSHVKRDDPFWMGQSERRKAW